MKYLILCFLLLAPWAVAAPGEPSAVVLNFETAMGNARKWQDVQSFFSSPSLKALGRLNNAQQVSTFAEHKSSMANMPANVKPKVQQQIQGNKASVRLHSERIENGNQIVNTRTYDLDLEGGAWKIDLLDSLEVDEDE